MRFSCYRVTKFNRIQFYSFYNAGARVQINWINLQASHLKPDIKVNTLQQPLLPLSYPHSSSLLHSPNTPSLYPFFSTHTLSSSPYLPSHSLLGMQRFWFKMYLVVKDWLCGRIFYWNYFISTIMFNINSLIGYYIFLRVNVTFGTNAIKCFYKAIWMIQKSLYAEKELCPFILNQEMIQIKYLIHTR